MDDRLDARRRKYFFAWPGLGNEPHDPNVRSISDLVALVIAALSEPADLVAQSMGGLIALRVALMNPAKVRRLVLTGTSGGLPVAALGGINWHENYRMAFPRAAAWITEPQEDLSAQIPRIAAETLLLWGDKDDISPPAVGRQLCARLPNARLHIVQGGDHDFPQTHAGDIAPLIAEHLD